MQVIYSASVGDATYKWLTMKIWEVEKLIQSAIGDECNSDNITMETFSAVDLYLRPQDMDWNVSGFCGELPLWL